MNRDAVRNLLATAATRNCVEIYFHTEPEAKSARLSIYKNRAKLRAMFQNNELVPSTEDLTAAVGGSVFAGDSAEVWIEPAEGVADWPYPAKPWRVCISTSRKEHTIRIL